MAIFTPETQTNEFDQYPGSPENPTCVADYGVCKQYVEGMNEEAVIGCCMNSTCECALFGDCTCHPPTSFLF